MVTIDDNDTFDRTTPTRRGCRSTGAGILYLNNGSWWPAHRQNITVTYAHGYALNESDLPEDTDIVRVPASIRLVALKLAASI